MPTLSLRKGVQIPQLGLGTFCAQVGECRSAVSAALAVGYRLIDTAAAYQNEHDVAAGIADAGLSRSDVFISTKLQAKEHRRPNVAAALRSALQRLGTDYVDLYLIHNPRGGNLLEVWPAMLRLRDEGLARAVGVSNFGIQQLEGLRSAGFEMPEVNQIELHCWWQQHDVVEYHKCHGIATMAYSPLARGQRFGQAGLAEVARDAGRSEAEVAIRWSLQMGNIVIPKSTKADRIRSNFAEGFCLSDEQMAAIAQLDCGYKSCASASKCMDLPWDSVAGSQSGATGPSGNARSGKGGQGKKNDSGRNQSGHPQRSPGSGESKGCEFASFSGAGPTYVGLKQGTVKLFHDEKGFGFIVPERGGPDVFVHCKDVVGGGLVAGDIVQYADGINERTGKPKAVTVVGGTGAGSGGKGSNSEKSSTIAKGCGKSVADLAYSGPHGPFFDANAGAFGMHGVPFLSGGPWPMPFGMGFPFFPLGNEFSSFGEGCPDGNPPGLPGGCPDGKPPSLPGPRKSPALPGTRAERRATRKA